MSVLLACSLCRERESVLAFFDVEGKLPQRGCNVQWILISSVQPLCALCLCGESFAHKRIHHRDTENSEDAQRDKLKCAGSAASSCTHRARYS